MGGVRFASGNGRYEETQGIGMVRLWAVQKASAAPPTVARLLPWMQARS
jgi:hypothetical protein